MNTPRTRLFRTAALAGLVGLALVSCGSDEPSDGPSPASGDVAVTIEGAWARTSPMNAANGAAYMSITSAEGDTLETVEVGATIAKIAQIHETVMADSSMTTDMSASTDAMASSDTAPAEMTMQEVDSLELPAGKAVELEPGGYHVMLMELAAPLELGQKFSLELVFAKAGTKTVEVTVADAAP